MSSGFLLYTKSVRSKGIFVTFEGTEGAGKSTLIRQIRGQLIRSNSKLKNKITLTREPGGSPVAETIREIILNHPMDPWTELFLYEASRAEHLSRTIVPSLKKGHLVLCDRYADSSLAYQGFARGLPWNSVKALNHFATRGITPDLTVLMDINPSRGLKRVKNVNRFEKEGLAFQTKVRRGFLKARSENPSRWLVLKIKNQTPEELAAEVIEALKKRLLAL
jgi:dTMP kinase